ncbi:CheR family methyltransferase [Ramlibacter sp. MMS24-I3-19]|uniref:CheR family methyltransferase n=1 Tax=Ramlibacter sp. MMS24-I3-19 TaxID=3416606 RepID=UPI003D03179C
MTPFPLAHDAQLDDAGFELAARMIREYAGIKLSPHKRVMVHNRLSREVRVRKLRGFAEYLALVQSDAPGEREAFINALTTNLTSFFREPHHFALLRQRMQARAATSTPFRVWCSACSTGEEAWSLAITLREAGGAAQVLATDIDTEALAAAQAGVYRMERAAAMPPQQLRDHFLRGTGDNAGWISVRPELRSLVTFRALNLQAPSWPDLGTFDAIFCRNVVIYFDRATQARLIDRFAQRLRPGGLLAVGHAECFPAGHQRFRSCGRTAYELVP